MDDYDGLTLDHLESDFYDDYLEGFFIEFEFQILGILF